MPDGGFKGMTPDPDSQKRSILAEPVQCEKCKGWIFEGDWPFCRGEGHADDHNRD
jgi:hypothetical protein